MPDQVLTVPAVLDRMARDLPDHPALITDDRELGFAELRAEVRRAAAAMIARGVRAGDRVVIWSPNTWHWVVAALGVHYAGGVLVPVNTGYTTTEAVDVLDRSRARLLVAAEAFAGLDRVAAVDRTALPSLVDIVRVPLGSSGGRWAPFLDGPTAPPAEVDARAGAVRPEDVAEILFTSGTTGRSKGVMCAQRQSLSAAAAGAECRDPRPDDRLLCMSPFFHNFGYKGGILTCLLTGSTLVTQRGFDIEAAMRSIDRHRITILPGSPTFFRTLLNHPCRPKYDLSSLRLVATGGAPVPVELVERLIAELGVESVLTGYGLTEASGYGTACRVGDDPVTVATTCGRPIANFELHISCPDETGAGEILLRGPNVMLGYLDDPAATAAVIDADGWLHTGDVGMVDAGGYLRVSDRKTDMFICGGVNIYPAEVESVLAGAEGVAAAAVIGVPDDRLGEVGRAFLVPLPGRTVDRATVIACARARLAAHKIPRSIVILDEMPRNAAGKVLKTALREIEYVPPPPLKPAGLGGPPVGHVEAWVADAWQVLLNIERPGRRDRFVDLGGDSLAAVEFSEMLQNQFGVAISVDSLAERPTVAAVVAGLQPGVDRLRQPVVRLRADGAGPVCLMIPGVGGHAWQFTAVARELTGPCDVRAVSLMDLRDGPPNGLRTRIREAALAALEPTSEPESGPGRDVVVIGYSFGGMIAADAACWLIECGVPVQRLILLDPDPLDSAGPQWDPRFAVIDATYLRFAPGSPAARRLEEEITGLAAELQQAYLDGSVRLPPIPVSWLQTPKMAVKFASARTLFGTPVPQIAKTNLELGHLGMLGAPQVGELARWVDAQLKAD